MITAEIWFYGFAVIYIAASVAKHNDPDIASGPDIAGILGLVLLVAASVVLSIGVNQ